MKVTAASAPWKGDQLIQSSCAEIKKNNNYDLISFKKKKKEGEREQYTRPGASSQSFRPFDPEVAEWEEKIWRFHNDQIKN